MMQAIYTILYSIEGCTDPTAYNYDPTATTDDGSCTGQKGDINLDECINILDLVILTDIKLGNYQPNEYEVWAADLNDDGIIDDTDQYMVVDIILNSPSCTGNSSRSIGN